MAAVGALVVRSVYQQALDCASALALDKLSINLEIAQRTYQECEIMVTAVEAYEQAKSAHERRTHYSALSFLDAKARRTQEYLRDSFGWKLRTCTACSGSGYYDHNGSPKCRSCNGSGRETYPGPKALPRDFLFELKARP